MKEIRCKRYDCVNIKTCAVIQDDYSIFNCNLYNVETKKQSVNSENKFCEWEFKGIDGDGVNFSVMCGGSKNDKSQPEKGLCPYCNKTIKVVESGKINH